MTTPSWESRGFYGSCGNESKAWELTQRAQSIIDVHQADNMNDDNHQIVRVLLGYARSPNQTKEEKLLLMDDLCRRFEALGSHTWAIKARNVKAVELARMPGKQELAIQTWKSALAVARDLCGSVLFHPAFMVFVDLAGRLQTVPEDLLALFESVALGAYIMVSLYSHPEALWVLVSLRRMRAGDFGVFIWY